VFEASGIITPRNHDDSGYIHKTGVSFLRERENKANVSPFNIIILAYKIIIKQQYKTNKQENRDELTLN
jgi:hypothetical protein